jgi:hypothetical protein
VTKKKMKHGLTDGPGGDSCAKEQALGRRTTQAAQRRRPSVCAMAAHK